MEKMKCIAFIGRPCSRKSPYALEIAKKNSFILCSPGKLIRQGITNGSVIEKTINENFRKGELVDDNWVTNLVEKTILDNPQSKGIVLDGYPRTANQVNHLKKLVAQKLIREPIFFYLDLSRYKSIYQMKERAKIKKQSKGFSVNNVYVRQNEFDKRIKSIIELIEEYDYEKYRLKIKYKKGEDRKNINNVLSLL